MPTSDVDRGEMAAAFERRLRQAMEDAKIPSINKLAQKAGMRWQTIDDWIKGVSRPRMDSLERIAEVLSVSPEELVRAVVDLDPPYPAFKRYLASPEGANTTDEERRSLALIDWLEGTDPDERDYAHARSMLRNARKKA